MQNRTYAFVVRVWLESIDSAGKIAIWRGSIEQVGSDYRVYFADLDGLTKFIQTQIGVRKPPSTSTWHLLLEQSLNVVRKFWNRLRHRNI